MKPISTTIYYGEKVPNIPVLKNKLRKTLNEDELNYAKEIVDAFLNKTLISKTFFHATTTSPNVLTSRRFDIERHDIEPNKEILEYAALTIFGEIYNNENCPDILEVTLKYNGTVGLCSDRALQEFVKGTPKNIFIISLETRASY